VNTIPGTTTNPVPEEQNASRCIIFSNIDIHMSNVLFGVFSDTYEDLETYVDHGGYEKT
jgi:hypothetical protein